MAGWITSFRTAHHLARVLSLLVLVLALGGCQSEEVPEGYASVRIAGERFILETAMTDQQRLQGLSGRESIPDDGGMIFVFPNAAPRGFVMRDCLVPIDILYIADNSRVMNSYTMQVDPRRDDESDAAYNARLRRYTSQGSVRVVIELKGGTIDRLGIVPGDPVDIDDLEALKAATK